VENDNSGNLLQALHRWATGQDENFTTDAFAHLLRHLVSEEPKAAARILARITGRECWDSLLQAPPESRKVEIVTQDPGMEGVPDIKIKAPGVLVYIEAKSGSDVDPDQLRRYRREIERALAQDKVLLLLTRKPVNMAELPAPPDAAVRWFQVGEWLDEELKLANNHEKSRVTAYLIRQFTGFLKAGGMSVEKVNWQLTEGIRSLVALVQMVREAAVNCGAESTTLGGAMDFCGHNFTIRKRWYWTGIYYSEPETLQFEASGVNRNRAEKIGFGFVRPYRTKGKDSYNWCNRLDLGSEEVHFFARTKSNQILCVEQFLKESIQASAASLGQKEKAG
jgi:hypothetical protein